MKREEILYCLKADSVGYTESCNKCMYGDKTDVGTCYSKHLLAAIKALEQEPCEPCEGSVYLTREAYGELCYKAAKWNELEKCGDAISRAEAIRVASGFCHHANIAKELGELPSVQPEQKMGHWIPCTVSSGRDSWKCSECGRRARGKIKNLPYCHCGAKMAESEDKE